VRPQSGPPRPKTGETRTSATVAHLSVNICSERHEIPEAQFREVPATEPFEAVLAAHSNGRLSVAQLERDDHRAQSFHTQAEWNKLRADLAEALEQVEHWRTLAEYRGSRLVERQERQTGDRC